MYYHLIQYTGVEEWLRDGCAYLTLGTFFPNFSLNPPFYKSRIKFLMPLINVIVEQKRVVELSQKRPQTLLVKGNAGTSEHITTGVNIVALNS